jgi:hypothetical protein
MYNISHLFLSSWQLLPNVEKIERRTLHRRASIERSIRLVWLKNRREYLTTIARKDKNTKKKLSGYPESPSDMKFVRILDSRLRGNDGRAVTLRHTREGGYPESITQLGLCR